MSDTWQVQYRWPRACSGCTECCTLLSVRGMTEPGEKCKNDAFGGCLIYDAKPKQCTMYMCMWRLDEGFPFDHKPSDVGVVVDVGTNTAVEGPVLYVRESRPDAFKGVEKTLWPYIESQLKAGRCVAIATYDQLQQGGKVSILQPKGRVNVARDVKRKKRKKSRGKR